MAFFFGIGMILLISGVNELLEKKEYRGKYGVFDFVRLMYIILLMVVIPGFYVWIVSLILKSNLI